MVEGIRIDPARPLIISDADEVLLQFMAGLERFLDRLACYMDFASFRIHGNVKHRASGDTVEDETVTGLLKAFFASETGTLEAVPGAAAALADLSKHAQIIILSNLPETSCLARIENLLGKNILMQELAPNSSINFNTTKIHINSQGLRDKEYALTKSPGMIRVAVMGLPTKWDQACTMTKFLNKLLRSG